MQSCGFKIVAGSVSSQQPKKSSVGVSEGEEAKTGVELSAVFLEGAASAGDGVEEIPGVAYSLAEA